MPNDKDPNAASLTEVYTFFAGSSREERKDYPLAAFRKSWADDLTAQDKEDLSSGIGNGSLTY